MEHHHDMYCILAELVKQNNITLSPDLDIVNCICVLCILVVYHPPRDTVTSDLFVSTISYDRRVRRGAGYRSIPGCWWSYFNSWTMLTRTVCAKVYAVHPESTRGEVTRIRYLVTRITYLNSLNVSYLPHFSAGENVDPRILNPKPGDMWIE